MIDDIRDLHQQILASGVDDTTKVHLFKVLDSGPTQSEMHLVNQLLKQNERHKFIDSESEPNLNPR